MQKFLERNPRLAALGKNGSAFLVTLLSHNKGFSYLTIANEWTKKELERWMQRENKIYVE